MTDPETQLVVEKLVVRELAEKTDPPKMKRRH
jgi:hypothetical protein